MDLPLETSASLDARFLNRNSVGIFIVEFLVVKTVVSNDLVKRLASYHPIFRELKGKI